MVIDIFLGGFLIILQTQRKVILQFRKQDAYNIFGNRIGDFIAVYIDNHIWSSLDHVL